MVLIYVLFDFEEENEFSKSEKEAIMQAVRDYKKIILITSIDIINEKLRPVLNWRTAKEVFLENFR